MGRVVWGQGVPQGLRLSLTTSLGPSVFTVEWRSERDSVNPVQPCLSVGVGTRTISSFTYIKMDLDNVKPVCAVFFQGYVLVLLFCGSFS